MRKIYSILALVLMLTMIFCTSCDAIFGNKESTTSATESTTEKPTTTTPVADPDPDPDPDPDCTEHIDENNDARCDKCDEEIKEDEVPVELPDTTIYLVGDSTVCSFNDNYLYPRYGYGTQIGSYMTDKVTVENLALSGRSSKSFILEANYTTLKNSLKAGDILVIGFGHNDEKSDDSARFTDASKPYTDPSSFGYHLYEYYIKLAEEKGAIPILCTPIVRAKSNNDYSGSSGHITETGDYAKAIREVGEAYGVAVIDLTTLTRSRYVEIGYEEALYYHAVTVGKYDTDGTTVIPNFASVDTTHLNLYGAKYVAYLFAKEFAELDGIGGYVRDAIEEPTRDCLVIPDGYEVPDYTAPDLDNYKAPDHFATTSEGWYGTAFGNTGGVPTAESNGYIAKEVSEGVFQVGQYLDGNYKGKFQNADDGFAFLFRQVEADKNFTLTVTGKIINTVYKNQVGFGLMLRDDCIVGQDLKSIAINSNFVTAGFLYYGETSMGVNFYRENASLNKGTAIDGAMPQVGDTFTCTIERVGQVVNVTVEYNGHTYTATHTDFDFFARDNDYMYVGMFSNRGTIVQFENVVFTITGESQGA